MNETVHDLNDALGLLELLEQVISLSAERGESLAPWNGMRLVTRQCRELISGVRELAAGSASAPVIAPTPKPFQVPLATRIRRLPGRPHRTASAD